MNEDKSKHMITVLRMEKDEEVLLTDGKGKKARARIIDPNRKKCTVEISSLEPEERTRPEVSMGISLIKNSSRFEWFLEKATELGVREIIPLVCERTAKEKFRFDRMQSILVSAMLQSQQSWLPQLHQPTSFDIVLAWPFERKFIAHCLEEKKQSLSSFRQEGGGSSLMLIGPEGDFTPTEIQKALKQSFIPVSLGPTRLRTETAGIAAIAVLRLGSEW